MGNSAPKKFDGRWLAGVPLELHGHRKKLAFFLRSLEAFRTRRGLSLADTRVVEVGCSNGRNIALPLAEQGYRVTGVDIHEPSIAYASAHNLFQNARFLCQDFADFSSNEFFDVVVLSDILEHVEEPLHIIRTAMTHLAPGGMVLVCIPNGYGPYENEQRFLRVTRLNKLIEGVIHWGKRLMQRRMEKQAEYNYDSGHIQFFRIRDFESLATSAGLRIEERANGALFGGGATYYLGLLLPFIVTPSLRLADRLPSRWASTWYFRLGIANNSRSE
jgi:2-polyprenyl-3-methyl-5-hydroxy-6-metoxy-1,4-benzoquinol methylase